LNDGPPAAHAALRQFLRFAAIGAGVLLVDALLYALLLGTGLPATAARAGSLFVCIGISFLLNRRFTFGRRAGRPAGGWARAALLFYGTQAGGAALNWTVSMACVAAWPAPARDWPFFVVAAGSLAGLSWNFVAARQLVFGRGRADGG